MAISRLIAPYFLTLLIFLAVDLLWLGVVAKKIYTSALSKWMAEKPNWWAALIFYLLFIVGLFIFSIVPALENGQLSKAATLGALFGFFTYSTYDLTNLALMKNWPVKIVILDIIWGSFVTGIAASAGFIITNWLG